MQGKDIHAIIVSNYGEIPEYKTKPLPEPKENQILVKVEASTINPSDRIFIDGNYFRRPLPTTAGFEGVGKVQKAGSAALEKFIGKRVSFTATSGSWAQYSTSSEFFVIDEDVPLASAASGIVNPLTVLGFIQTYRSKGHSGIIHTAAASALGRQLNKICQTQKIPLLNVVRRKEQAELLKSEGAEHVLVTQGDWEKEYHQLLKAHKFDAYFDALGGGQVTSKLINGLSLPATVYVYGLLTKQPLKLDKGATQFLSGLHITGFLLFTWWKTCPQADRQRIISQYSKYLKGDLSTKTFKQMSYKNIKEALELSVSNATDGKILLKIE